MRKSLMFLALLAGTALLVALAGVASARTYNFTNSPLLHEAYEGGL